MTRKKQEIRFAAVVMIVLLAVRTLGQVLNLLLAESIVLSAVFFLFAIAYVAAIVGVVRLQKWGSAIAAVVASVDAAAAFVSGGAFGIGALVVDLLIIVLALQEIKMLNGGKSRK